MPGNGKVGPAMWKQVLIGLPLLLHAQSSWEFVGRAWFADPGSRIRAVQNGFGTDIDARGDLGITRTTLPEGGFAWRRGRSLLRFEYAPIDLTGDQTVSRTLVFRGQSYTVGTRIVSDLSVQHLQLSWAYQVVNAHDGRFRLGPMIEADGFLMRGSLGRSIRRSATDGGILRRAPLGRPGHGYPHPSRNRSLLAGGRDAGGQLRVFHRERSGAEGTRLETRTRHGGLSHF
jgi:hypothetical protein